jgi:hypothetical protein
MDTKEHNGTSGTASLESGLATTVRRAQAGLREQLHACEDSVRQSPTNALLIAGVTGYVLRSLPIGALLGGVIRIITALLRPALFIYLAAKLYENVQRGATASAPSAAAKPSRSRQH